MGEDRRECADERRPPDDGSMRPDHDPAWSAYATAVLEIGPEPVVVDVAKPLHDDLRRDLARLGLGAGFGVVTAANPRGIECAAAENAARHRRLLAAVEASDWSWCAGDGRSPDGTHRQRGVAVAAPRHAVLDLGRRFDQSAVYWYDGADLHLLGALVRGGDRRLPA